ncbi:M28 family peptidase [Gemelliphila palaticanis]|uniref:M28 family peptidase n=1 Tax=Gemelliphila palaticanis TaxID=81950 RepID=A0ABX2T1T9_9BACL|nr:M28 family peptidase [Gemella palaticanis]MBF0715240.1 M28 family peptidase [Gemella palaticanis]NYS47170.1 M28 family peptidase [Gemella palaticanis]
MSNIYINKLNNYVEKINTGYSFDISKSLLKYKTNKDLGYRTAGSKAEHEAAEYLFTEMIKLGLTNVKKEKFYLDGWTFEKAEMTFNYEGKYNNFILGGYQTNFDTKGKKKYEIVYLNKGTKKDYREIDIKDKLVLIDINQKDEWWVNYPALQANYKGAAGVIVAQSEGFSEVNDDALNANDIIGPDYAHILSITNRDANILKEILFSNNNSFEVYLDVKSSVEKNTIAYNVTGEIEGEDKDSYIIYSSHYDAYFDGFQDNATAVGIMYGIAKAFVDSGYKPKRTLIFTALAAEEWGTSNTRYDWSTGAYNEVFNINRHWQGKAVLNINFELPAFLHNPFDEITAGYELEEYLNNFVNTIPAVKDAYTESTKVLTPLTTWADDWSFSIGGIPAVRNDFTSSKFRETHYHTNFDNVDTYNERVFYHHHLLYGALAINYDMLAVAPLDFTNTISKIKSSLLEYKNVINTSNNDLIVLLDKLLIKLSTLTSNIGQTNKDYLKLIYEDIDKANVFYNNSQELNKKVLSLFRYFQDNFLRLNWEDEPIFPHEQLCKNINNLNNAINSLEKNDINKAYDYIFQIDNNYLAYNFDKFVWDYFNNYVLDASPEKLMWGNGRIVSHCDLYELINLLDNNKNTDYTIEIDMLKGKLEEEYKKLDNILIEEINNLNKVFDLI